MQTAVDSARQTKYGSGVHYWDDRYSAANGSSFDWLESFESLQPYIEVVTEGNRDLRILHVGCGNSVLAEHIYDAGYHNIVNLDNSKVVIKQMQARQAAGPSRPGLRWVCMDALDMTFEDAQFDIVIDKATIDTFVCAENSTALVAAYLAEVTRVLPPCGFFLLISLGEPAERMHFLKNSFESQHLDFQVTAFELETNDYKNYQNYLYACMKGFLAEENMKTQWPIMKEVFDINQQKVNFKGCKPQI